MYRVLSKLILIFLGGKKKYRMWEKFCVINFVVSVVVFIGMYFVVKFLMGGSEE